MTKPSAFKPGHNVLRTIGLPAVLTGVLLFSSPGFADPPARDAGKFYGYSSVITDMLDETHKPRAPKDPYFEPPATARSALRDNTQIREMLTPHLYMKPEPGKMIPTLLRLHQQQPLSPKITRKLALTCLKAGQPREALHWFTKTYQLDRQDIQALWNMAALAYRLGDFSRTAAFLKEYARVDPNTAWGKLAREYQESGNFAGVDFSKSFDGEPSRVGIVTSGSGQTPGSLLMIDGQPASLEEEVPIAAPPLPPPPTKSGKRAKAGKEAKEVQKPISDAGFKPLPPPATPTLANQVKAAPLVADPSINVATITEEVGTKK